MSDFIVLGRIPGTELVLTFTLWLLLAGTLLSVFVVRRAWHWQQLRRGIVTISLVMATWRRIPSVGRLALEPAYS